VNSLRSFAPLFGLALLLPGLGIAQEYAPDANTVALWHFNEGSGTTVYDTTSNNNDGTISGAAWTTSGQYKDALIYDGVDDYVNMGAVNTTTGKITLEAWVRVTAFGGAADHLTIFSKRTPTENPGDYWFIITGSGEIYFQVWEANNNFETVNSAVGEITAGIWYHVAVTFDDVTDEVRLYKNGVNVALGSITKALSSNTDELWIGKDVQQSLPFDGIIDEVHVSDLVRISFNSDGGSWTSKANMPTARHNAASAVIGDTLYVIGGSTGDETSLVQAYDQGTNTWLSKASLPAPRTSARAALVNGKIYVAGGGNNNVHYTTMQVYDPVSNSWSTSSAMNAVGRTGPGVAALDGLVYVAGGHNGTVSLASMEIYDPATDSWTYKASMSVGRHHIGLVVVAGKLYAIGGHDGSAGIPTNLVEEYDPVLNTWATKSLMPTARQQFGIAVVNDRIFVIGGEVTIPTAVISTVEEYDPATDTWVTVTNFPNEAGLVAAKTINARIYAAGGNEFQPTVFLNTLYEYTPRAAVSAADVTPPAAPSGLTVTPGDGQVNLSWSRNTEADFLRYRIYGGTATAPTAQVDSTSLGINDTSKTITGLSNGTTYYYRLTAVDSAGNESGYSSEVSGAPIAAFSDIAAGLTGVDNSSVSWGDYDNDGDLDILLTGDATVSSSGYITKIYRNDGSGTFTDISAALIGVRGGSATWGDYDNDGDLDILLVGESNDFSIVSKVYRNDGSGSLTDISASLTGAKFGSAAWGDYDNDGDLDVLLTGRNAGGSPVSKLYRNDAGIFTDISAGLLGVESSAVAWGDYDNDGDLDILLAGQSATSTYNTKLYRNDSGSFVEVTTSLTPVLSPALAWGDYDDDGDLDILLTGLPSTLPMISKVYRNDAGSFTDINAGLRGLSAGSAVWGDYDNDGDLDIALSGTWQSFEYESKVYRNDGGTFVDISADLAGVFRSSIAWGDYDADGDLDILLSGRPNTFETYSRVYRNNIGTANTAPTAPTALTHTVTENTVALGWAKSTDIQTAQDGLTYNLRVGTQAATNELVGNEVMSAHADTSGFRRIAALGNVGQTTSWTLAGLSPASDREYTWSVQAVDNAFAGSAFAAAGNFTIDVPPAVPTGLTATASYGQITLTWSPNTEADFLRYRIYGGTATAPTTQVDSTDGGINDTTATITGLTNGQIYYYRITAVDGGGNESGYSDEVTVKPGLLVLSTSPAQNALNVPLDATISVTFGVDINPATVNANTFVVHGSYTGKLSGTYAYNSGTKTATFTPDQPFKVGEQVNVTVTTGVTSAAGDTLVQPMVWDFTAEVLGGSGMFSAKVDYSVASAPLSVTVADLDGDGDLDLAASNTNSNNVSVLLKNGAGSYAVAVNYAVGSVPTSVTAADLDGDGDADLAVANYSSNNVSVLLSNGDGTFAPKVDYGVGSSPWSVTAADLDGNGGADLAVANEGSSNVSILLGNGDGTFAPRVDYGVGSFPRSVTAADLDGDGDADLAVANYSSNNVSVLLSNGDGTFAPKVDYGVGSSPWSVTAADLDGDGDIDLAVANSGASTLSVLLGNGDGTFQAKTDYGTGASPTSVIVADLDGDGDIDLAAANSVVSASTVSVLLGNGDGTFQGKTDYGTGSQPMAVFAADLDGDGDLDLAVANSGDNTVSILLNLGQADIALSADSLSFGSTNIGATDSLMFKVYNNGIDSTLQVSNISSSNPAFAASPASFSVLPGDSATVTVTFTPTAMQTYSDSLTISSNDPQQPQVKVYVSGVGDPILAVSPTQNALNVPLDATISITFGVDVNPATVNANTFVVHGSYTGKLGGAYSYDSATKTATFTPDSSFKVGEQVSVTVTRGVQTPVGDPVPAHHSWGFTIVSIGGSGKFYQALVSTAGSAPTHITTGDWDNDGDLDLATANSGALGGEEVSILKNDGGGGGGVGAANVGDLEC